jgi:hypothetical protein
VNGNEEGGGGVYRGVVPSSGLPSGVRLEQGVAVLSRKVPGEEDRYVATDAGGRPVALYSPWPNGDGPEGNRWLRQPVFELDGEGSQQAAELGGDSTWAVELPVREQGEGEAEASSRPGRRLEARVGGSKRVTWKDC